MSSGLDKSRGVLRDGDMMLCWRVAELWLEMMYVWYALVRWKEVN